jgi:hypothetical protein
MQLSSERKTDDAIYKIVCAAIRRKSGNLDSWQFTRLWENEKDDIKQEIATKCSFVDHEIPILSVYFDKDTWVLFSTRYIHYSNVERQDKIATEEVYRWDFGDFKGYKTKIDRMTVFTKDEQKHCFFFETGFASMGPIYALSTLAQIT